MALLSNLHHSPYNSSARQPCNWSEIVPSRCLGIVNCMDLAYWSRRIRTPCILTSTIALQSSTLTVIRASWSSITTQRSRERQLMCSSKGLLRASAYSNVSRSLQKGWWYIEYSVMMDILTGRPELHSVVEVAELCKPLSCALH